MYTCNECLKVLSVLVSYGHSTTINRRNNNNNNVTKGCCLIENEFQIWSAHLTLLERALAVDFLSVCLSVCRSVYLSNLWIVTERNNLRSTYQHHTIERCFWFLETKCRGSGFSGLPRTSVLKTGTPCQKRKFDQ